MQTFAFFDIFRVNVFYVKDVTFKIDYDKYGVVF